jgi:hypothetical protein
MHHLHTFRTTEKTRRVPVYGELLFHQATWHARLLHPFLYVIDSKRALGFGEAQRKNSIQQFSTQCNIVLAWNPEESLEE